MDIEIKKSIKPIKYNDALTQLEARSKLVSKNEDKELIWILEHEPIFTAGTSYSKNDIIDKSINICKTNRGGKITYHGPGQLMFYFVIDLRSRPAAAAPAVGLNKLHIKQQQELVNQVFSVSEKIK